MDEKSWTKTGWTKTGRTCVNIATKYASQESSYLALDEGLQVMLEKLTSPDREAHASMHNGRPILPRGTDVMFRGIQGGP